MVASVVQSASAFGTTTSVTVTLGAAPTVGNALLAVMASDTTASAVPNAGTSKPYTQRLAAVNNQGFYIWTRAIVSGDSATTTFTPSTASPSALTVVEVQGTYDKIGTNSSTINTAGASRATTSVTPATADNLVLTAIGIHGIQNAQSGASADNGFTMAVSNFNVSTGGTLSSSLVAQKATASTAASGATTVSWTGNCLDRDGVQIAFTGVAGGAAQPRIRRIGKRR